MSMRPQILASTESGKGVVLSGEQMQDVMRRLINPDQRKYMGQILIPSTYGPVVIKTRDERLIDAFFESCAFKCIMSGVLGKIDCSWRKNVKLPEFIFCYITLLLQ